MLGACVVDAFAKHLRHLLDSVLERFALVASPGLRVVVTGAALRSLNAAYRAVVAGLLEQRPVVVEAHSPLARIASAHRPAANRSRMLLIG